jgi:hypothetical protein
MGMMTRRNVKQRVVVKTTPVNTEKAKEKNYLEEFAYTKTEINRMSTADLKELARENGLDDSLSGADIKKALIAKFDL